MIHKSKSRNEISSRKILLFDGLTIPRNRDANDVLRAQRISKYFLRSSRGMHGKQGTRKCSCGMKVSLAEISLISQRNEPYVLQQDLQMSFLIVRTLEKFYFNAKIIFPVSCVCSNTRYSFQNELYEQEDKLLRVVWCTIESSAETARIKHTYDYVFIYTRTSIYSSIVKLL